MTCAQRRLGSESLGPWLPLERIAKTGQIPGPMGDVLKNDVHYVLVICNPDPIGAGDMAVIKCHDLTAASSPVLWNHGHGAFDSHAQTAEVISHLPARI